ncbi:hypothetical protein OY671_011902 [Metschnikowia pulcherrima]|nr:hypothetical protein OY671_011902 [Metschnikowia pulcherrima]
MVNDVIAETRRRSIESGVETAEDVRAAPSASAGFSAGMADEERALKRFMYDRLYYHPEQIATAERACSVIAASFTAYAEDPARMPESWQRQMPQGEPGRSPHVADFLAGMPDRSAIDSFTRPFRRAPQGSSNV